MCNVKRTYTEPEVTEVLKSAGITEQSEINIKLIDAEDGLVVPFTQEGFRVQMTYDDINYLYVLEWI